MLSRMPGPVALVGSGEFLPSMAEVDAGLLAATGRRRPRVALLPTASWPDGEEVFRRWASMGVEHFSALGAEVEPVLLRDRFDANDVSHVQAIGEADLVYLSGGKPGHLTDSLASSPVGAALIAAHERGAVLEDQEGFPALRVGSPSRTVNVPRSMVWTTRPPRVRPVNAEFRAEMRKRGKQI